MLHNITSKRQNGKCLKCFSMSCQLEPSCNFPTSTMLCKGCLADELRHESHVDVNRRPVHHYGMRRAVRKKSAERTACAFGTRIHLQAVITCKGFRAQQSFLGINAQPVRDSTSATPLEVVAERFVKTCLELNYPPIPLPH